MIKSKEGILKVPSILSSVVSQNGENCTITLSHKQAKIVAVVAIVLFVAALVLSIWGIARQAEIVQLRQQTQLQTEQLKLLQQKTEVLDKKIQNLNQISEENKQMLYLPEGFAHGFVVLSDEAEFLYKVSNEYSPEHDRGIRWNDPDINVQWGIDFEPNLSEKDKKQPFLKDVTELL